MDSLDTCRSALLKELTLTPEGHGWKKYIEDPVGFVKDILHGDPAPYQEEALVKLKEHRRVSLRGPHGLGKTALMSWASLWFGCTRPNDTKIPTTASAWRQLEKFLWPEIRKWARLADWDKWARMGGTIPEIFTLKLKVGEGCEAFALASDNEELIEGAHGTNLLYVFDESKAIPNATWDAAEGSFATGDAYWISCSTPGDRGGRFYDIQRRSPGYTDWWTKHVTLQDAIEAGRISKEWADARRDQWGESSPVYQARVLGEFPEKSENTLIGLSLVDAAVERWKVWRDDGFLSNIFTGVGVDVGLGGEHSDKEVLALCYDHCKIKELRKNTWSNPGTATMETVGRVKGVLDAYGGTAYVDVIGIGAGVVHRLKEQKCSVTAFNSAEGTTHKDKSGELGFTNKRSAGWWIVREMLQPDSGLDVMLPDDSDLIGELTSPTSRTMSGARIQVEAKPSIRSRIGRSTDCADAVIYILAGPTLHVRGWARGASE